MVAWCFSHRLRMEPIRYFGQHFLAAVQVASGEGR